MRLFDNFPYKINDRPKKFAFPVKVKLSTKSDIFVDKFSVMCFDSVVIKLAIRNFEYNGDKTKDPYGHDREWFMIPKEQVLDTKLIDAEDI